MEFDISYFEQARFTVDRQNGLFLVVMGSVALAATIGWTLVWVISPPYPPTRLIILVWAVLGLMCPILIFFGLREPRGPATKLVINQSGIRLVLGGGGLLSLPWDDAETKLSITDLRSAGFLWRKIPMLLGNQGKEYGLSREAGTAVLAAAEEGGLPIRILREYPRGQPFKWAIGGAPLSSEE